MRYVLIALLLAGCAGHDWYPTNKPLVCGGPGPCFYQPDPVGPGPRGTFDAPQP